MTTHIYSRIRSANFELRRLVPSVIFCPQMPHGFLSLPLFFHALNTAILSCMAVPSISKNNNNNNNKKFKTTLLALSWEFPKLTSSSLLLSIGCPLIHEYCTNSLLCATTASTRPILSTWLKWKFTNQPASYAHLLILPFCLPSAHALAWLDFVFSSFS